jgi:hypothetical protein
LRLQTFIILTKKEAGLTALKNIMEIPLTPIDGQNVNDSISKDIFNSDLNTNYFNLEEIRIRLSAETGKNFFKYIKSFNLTMDKYLCVLSPSNHYYYDKRELRRVKTLVNLKKLNAIEELNEFLLTLSLLLPPDSNFIGCFSDSKTTLGQYGFFPKLTERVNNFLDSRTVNNLDRKKAARLLEKNGFKVIDMMEIDQLTYFYAQTVCRAASS